MPLRFCAEVRYRRGRKQTQSNHIHVEDFAAAMVILVRMAPHVDIYNLAVPGNRPLTNTFSSLYAVELLRKFGIEVHWSRSAVFGAIGRDCQC